MCKAITLTPIKSQKHVSFAEESQFVASRSPLDESNVDYSLLWWHESELRHFRDNARSICFQMRENVENSGDTRGLEGRCCLERQKRRFLAVRCIVRAQPQLQSESELAALALRCTTWAANLAAKVGTADFLAAHAEDASMPTKRHWEGHDERRVRPRLDASAH